MAAVLAALGACTSIDDVFYGGRQGTIEYPGSGAAPGAVPIYVVKVGDTVDSIAKRFGVTTQSVVDRNHLQPPYQLRAGQTLDVPGARVVDTTEEPPPAPGAPPTPGKVQREPLAPPEAGQPPGNQPGQPTQLNQPGGGQQVTVGATPPPPAPRFIWPVQGPVVTSYGTAGGQKSDGIDIQAAKGTPVKAADSGTVVYAGNEVRGMGNLLLVSHAGGYITAYGFNDQLLVAKGAAVKKGQAIAKVGTSGSSTEARLHFEVRRANKTIDPQTVLPTP